MFKYRSPRERFVIMPATDQTQTFIVYDALLEQPIGRPGPLKKRMEMASYLNRMTPHFENN